MVEMVLFRRKWIYEDWLGEHRKWKMVLLKPGGDMKTGWLYDKNIWYYLNNDGSMAVNRSQDGWYLGADGAGRKE